MVVTRLKGWAEEVHDQKAGVLDAETVLRNLGAWMKAQGLNSSSMADKMGYDRTYIFRLLTGERPVTAAFKWKFLEAFGTAPTNAVFYGRQPDPQTANDIPSTDAP